MSFMRFAPISARKSLTQINANTKHLQNVLFRCFTASNIDYSTEREIPVKFSTSKAKSHNPMDTFIPPKQRGKSEMASFIGLGSLLTALFYLAIREENSLDRIFEKTLEQNVPNIKEMTLRNEIQKYEEMGLDTRKLKLALKEETESQKNKKV